MIKQAVGNRLQFAKKDDNRTACFNRFHEMEE